MLIGAGQLNNLGRIRKNPRHFHRFRNNVTLNRLSLASSINLKSDDASCSSFFKMSIDSNKDHS